MNLMAPKMKTPSILEMAEEQKNKKKAEQLESIAEDICNGIKDVMYSSEGLQIKDYSIIMQSANKKLSDWFNEQINSMQVVDVFKKDDARKEPTD